MNKKPAKKAAPASKKKEYSSTWRPATQGSEGPKKRTPAKKEYSRTWRPATPGSEGPKKKVAKKPVMRKK